MLCYRMELKLIHAIMSTENYIPGKTELLDLKYVAFNTFAIGDENLTAGTGNLIEIPQVQTG